MKELLKDLGFGLASIAISFVLLYIGGIILMGVLWLILATWYAIVYYPFWVSVGVASLCLIRLWGRKIRQDFGAHKIRNMNKSDEVTAEMIRRERDGR